MELDLGPAAGQHAGQRAAPAPRQLCVGADFFDHVLTAGVDEMGGAKLTGESQPLLDRVNADERMGAYEAAELKREQTDYAEPVDDDRLADLDLGAAHAVQGHVSENAEGDLHIGQIVGQLLDTVLLRNDDFAGFELGCYKPVGGMVAAAEHTVADSNLVDLAARGLDDTDGCVAEPFGGKGGLLRGAGRTASADAVHLGAGADLGESCAYKHLIGCRGRHLELFDLDMARRGEDQSLSFCHANFLWMLASGR